MVMPASSDTPAPLSTGLAWTIEPWITLRDSRRMFFVSPGLSKLGCWVMVYNDCVSCYSYWSRGVCSRLRCGLRWACYCAMANLRTGYWKCWLKFIWRGLAWEGGDWYWGCEIN